MSRLDRFMGVNHTGILGVCRVPANASSSAPCAQCVWDRNSRNCLPSDLGLGRLPSIQKLIRESL